MEQNMTSAAEIPEDLANALAASAKTHGLARCGAVSAHRTRAGHVIWKINGNVCTRKDAQRRMDHEGWAAEASQ